MKREDVIRMAGEASMVTGPNLLCVDGPRYRSLGAATNIKELHLLEFAALVAAAERESMPAWMPIETAPKDYLTEFDGWNGERVPNVSWDHPEYSAKGHRAWCVSEHDSQGWINAEVRGLTHWMPLPPAPGGST